MTTEESHIVCVELGGNIQPEVYLPRAGAELRRRFTILGTSRAWETSPVGCDNCDNFLNAAVLIQTDLNPEELKEMLRSIEGDLGRVRTANKFAPRTIDIDILIYDGKLLEPDLWEYAHLAVPVAELLPEFSNQDTGEVLRNVANRLIGESLIKLCADVTLF